MMVVQPTCQGVNTHMRCGLSCRLHRASDLTRLNIFNSGADGWILTSDLPGTSRTPSSKSIKKARFEGELLRIRTVLWILPTPAAPWICRHDRATDLPGSKHKYAMRPILPLASCFRFGESQHFQL